VDITVRNTPRVGENIMLECSVTTIKDIAFRVDIEWRDNLNELLSKVDGVPVVSSGEDTDHEQHLDVYTIQRVSASDNGNTYRCTGVINTDPPLKVVNFEVLSIQGKLIINGNSL